MFSGNLSIPFLCASLFLLVFLTSWRESCQNIPPWNTLRVLLCAIVSYLFTVFYSIANIAGLIDFHFCYTGLDSLSLQWYLVIISLLTRSLLANRFLPDVFFFLICHYLSAAHILAIQLYPNNNCSAICFTWDITRLFSSKRFCLDRYHVQKFFLIGLFWSWKSVPIKKGALNLLS